MSRTPARTRPVMILLNTACSAALGVVMVACAPAEPIRCPDGGCPTPAPSQPAGEGAQSAPPPLETTDAIEACVRWRQADCRKFVSCFPDGYGCNESTAELRAMCREDLAESDCDDPNPASFDRCANALPPQTCQEYCPGGSFCGAFCFFSCRD